MKKPILKSPDGSASNSESELSQDNESVKFDHQYQKTQHSKTEKEKYFQSKVDIESVRRVYKEILVIESVQNALVNTLLLMSTSLKFDIKRNSKAYKNNANFLNIFIIIMENTSLHSPEYLEESFPAFCMAMAALPLEAQAVLVKIWSTFKKEELKRMVEVFQQLITFKVSFVIICKITVQFVFCKNSCWLIMWFYCKVP